MMKLIDIEARYADVSRRFEMLPRRHGSVSQGALNGQLLHCQPRTG
ncbi:MAG: hypothetical protein LC750_08520 [Actinobacteria bacterium]|nr:hypothetical protein [Actinomycetota bacterium]